MFRIANSHPWPPEIDLATVRETIAYIEGDMRRVPGLERIADALSTALEEIETVERDRPALSSVYPRPQAPIAARFLPRR